MADLDLRRLERGAKAGDPTDQAAWLRSQIRAGQAERSQVELAAWCGDSQACDALGWSPDSLVGLQWGICDGKGPVTPQDARIDDWIDDLLARWPGASIRATVAAARVLLHPDGLLLPPRLALDVADDWLICPCDRHRLRCGAIWSEQAVVLSFPPFAWQTLGAIMWGECHARATIEGAVLRTAEEDRVRSAVGVDLAWARIEARPNG